MTDEERKLLVKLRDEGPLAFDRVGGAPLDALMIAGLAAFEPFATGLMGWRKVNITEAGRAALADPADYVQDVSGADALVAKEPPPMMTLAAMRLKDMRRVHPEQDETHVCAQCGERVGIYPSGQQLLKDHPDLVVVCHLCALCARSSERAAHDLAAPAEVIVQEILQSKPREPAP